MVRHFFSNRIRVDPRVLLASFVASMSGTGCATQVTMSAPQVQSPVLVGPVACIGCPPRKSASEAPFADSSISYYQSAGGISVTTWERKRTSPGIGRTVGLVPDPCRADIHVSRLYSRAYGTYALIYGRSAIEIDLEASLARVELGSCWRPPGSDSLAPALPPRSIPPREKKPEARP